MKQATLPLSLTVKKTRKADLLAQMERVVPWVELVALIAPYYPEGKNGRPPFALETMLRTHFLQNGSPFQIRAWMKPSLIPPFTGSLPSLKNLPVCQTRAPS